MIPHGEPWTTYIGMFVALSVVVLGLIAIAASLIEDWKR